MMNKTKLIWSNRQPPNLKGILCPSKMCVDNKNDKKAMVTKCQGKKCEVCDLINPTNKVTFENGEDYIIKSTMNCNSYFVIYVIKCLVCQACYIGETTDFRDRANNHKKDIRHDCYRKLPVSKHIFNCSGTTMKFEMMPIYKCRNEDSIERKTLELTLIKKYKTSLNP